MHTESQMVVHSDLGCFLDVLPADLREAVTALDNIESELIEIVLDLGRLPQARLIGSEVGLSDKPVTADLLNHVESNIGDFGNDNRAGIERTLHRISSIRNRKGNIVGLTCRIGRAVHGSVELVRDLIEKGDSVLLLGRPGIGKTTMLREVARALADEHGKRVIIVDTSNEIAGDGDIPHPAIGRARRMQVAKTELQHFVMVEAVENHTPEVIIVDEMSTEQEAAASRTIAERGVQLIATAHGNTITNVLSNPTLADLLGGINTVTLGDDEAHRRGTQKTILERKHAPTFNAVVEIARTNSVLIHRDVATVVDNLLLGKPTSAEVRTLEDGKVAGHTVKVEADASFKPRQQEEYSRRRSGRRWQGNGRGNHNGWSGWSGGEGRVISDADIEKDCSVPSAEIKNVTRIFAYGISKHKLTRAAELAHASVSFVDDIPQADIFVTTKTHHKRCRNHIRDAELRAIPAYVLRRATDEQVSQFLRKVSRRNERHDSGPENWEVTLAGQEARAAAERITHGDDTMIQLEPQRAAVRRVQHMIARQFKLRSDSQGVDPERRVTLYAA